METKIKAEDHLGLVCIIAAKYAPKNTPVMDSEEYSDGILGLLKAIEKYDPEKHKTEFSTLAFNCIRKAIIQGWRTRNRKKRIVNNSVQFDDNTEFAKPSHYSCEDKFHLIARLFEPHPDDSISDVKYKTVLYDHHVHGKTWAEIGKDLGVTRARAQQYGKKALDLIKKRFNLSNQSLTDLIFGI